MSIVQLSRFLPLFPNDSFDSISKRFTFVKNFFLLSYPYLFRSVLNDSYNNLPYRFTVVNNFFLFFSSLFSSAFEVLFLSFSGRSASASPAELLLEFPLVVSDKWYLIILKCNCQHFFSFLFISDNSFNFVFSFTFSVLCINALLLHFNTLKLRKGTRKFLIPLP